ncbi:MAG: methylmalonyl Co-A mutase-associated GTPase MeaB [Acidimicrobiales bacterium]
MLARLLSAIERGDDDGHQVARLTATGTPTARTVGITGAPGAGKSTLTNALVAVARTRGERVAVLAIDPSSPFTGGAILGDRVRMSQHALDDGVFIRSMATRGHLGGLALATPEAVRLLDAVGFDWVLVETVGVGQVEVAVASAADTTVVVVNPAWGDAVQANKAGLMEVADVFVVNKADRPGADQTGHDLETLLDLTGRTGAEGAWRPPVIATTATTGGGAEALWDTIGAHHAHLTDTGRLQQRRRGRRRAELALVVEQRLRSRADELLGAAEAESLADAVGDGDLDPWSAADHIVGPLGA